MTGYVCLVFVCPRAHIWNYTSDLLQSFVHVTYSHGSVLLWQRCDTLCISGLMDDYHIKCTYWAVCRDADVTLEQPASLKVQQGG